MEDSFKNQIESANSILVLLPQDPSFDTVAAGLSFYLALKNAKTLSISSKTPMKVEFNRLVGVNKVTTDLGNKNLTISIENYDPNNIERFSYDIVNGQLTYIIVPNPGVAPPSENQVKLSYSGVSVDLLVLMGGKSANDFPAISEKDLKEVAKMHIGTSSLPGVDVMSFAKAASSVSEAVAMTLKGAGYKFDADSATNLVMGIDEGSGNYTGDSVTSETFQVVADLMKAGGKRIPKSQQVVAGAFPPGAIPGQVPPGQPMRQPMPQMQPRTQPQPVQVQARSETSDPRDIEGTSEIKGAPKNWSGPKIYKGTSTS